MLTTTLDRGLREYEIGEKIRALRLKKKMGLVELGRHTGLSPALLSKIERGKLFPTLPTLLRVALVFSVGLEFFFVGAREKPLVAVMRRTERVRLPERPDGRVNAFVFESLDFRATERKFNAYFAEFARVDLEDVRLHAHPGVEFIYTLEGTLGLTIGGVGYDLEPGDTIYFDSSHPHGYRRARGRACRAIVITANG